MTFKGKTEQKRSICCQSFWFLFLLKYLCNQSDWQLHYSPHLCHCTQPSCQRLPLNHVLMSGKVLSPLDPLQRLRIPRKGPILTSIFIPIFCGLFLITLLCKSDHFCFFLTALNIDPRACSSYCCRIDISISSQNLLSHYVNLKSKHTLLSLFKSPVELNKPILEI